jgi:hypothetical protein
MKPEFIPQKISVRSTYHMCLSKMQMTERIAHYSTYLPKMYTENYVTLVSGFSCDQSADFWFYYHNCEREPHL